VLIVWDEPKRLANLAKHGVDFAELSLDFFEGARISAARLGRYRALGLLGDRAVAVIFAPLGTEAVSVISMRPASANERKLL
jgi:uncharacterized DUF497 family protein